MSVVQWVPTADDDALEMVTTVLQPLVHLQHDEYRGRPMKCGRNWLKSQICWLVHRRTVT